MKVFNILTGKHQNDDYPYGRLRTTMFFNVEFKNKLGYRSVRQTINPKTGQLNKPKKSTYSDFMFMYEEESTGHIKFFGMHIRGFEDINLFIDILKANKIEMTEEESQNMYAHLIATIKISTSYSRLKEGVEVSQFLDTTKVREMIKLYGEKADINKLTEIGYDLSAIKELKQ